MSEREANKQRLEVERIKNKLQLARDERDELIQKSQMLQQRLDSLAAEAATKIYLLEEENESLARELREHENRMAKVQEDTLKRLSAVRRRSSDLEQSLRHSNTAVRALNNQLAKTRKRLDEFEIKCKCAIGAMKDRK